MGRLGEQSQGALLHAHSRGAKAARCRVAAMGTAGGYRRPVPDVEAGGPGMRALRLAFARLFGIFNRRADERRLSEEFEQHLAMATDDLIRSGLPAAEARRQARLTFGVESAMKEAYRDQRGLPWLESLGSDVVYGWRQLRKNRTTSA